MEEKDADPDDKDLMVTYYKSSGPGGQKKNKTESAVRIKHLPTGIIVTACESRSQSDNRERARQRLREPVSGKWLYPDRDPGDADGVHRRDDRDVRISLGRHP